MMMIELISAAKKDGCSNGACRDLSCRVEHALGKIRMSAWWPFHTQFLVIRGWRDEVKVRALVTVKERDTGEEILVATNSPVVPEGATEEQIIDYAYYALSIGVLHELDENLLVGSKRRRDPHTGGDLGDGNWPSPASCLGCRKLYDSNEYRLGHCKGDTP